ncbi:MAG: putative butyrate kinase 2 [Syntrophus sp. PtaU1.Bin208]|nr:MAG: putative butyrate kinase 2 [Syntrophus sp. PtaU1.Bin208]
MFRTLLINPGSTSSEVSLFEDEIEVESARMMHPVAELRKYPKILDQFPYRIAAIRDQLRQWNIQKGDLAAIVGRSFINRKESGAYVVNQKMIDDVKVILSRVEHAAGLGCMLAREIGDEQSIPAFVAHSAAQSLNRMAKVSGISAIERRAVYHVLNIEGVARLAAREMRKKMENVNLIIAHLEGGMSVAAVAGGELRDVSNAFEEGPFTTERSGSLPVVSLVELCFSGRHTREEILKMIRGEGGMVAYLGTNKISEIEKRVTEGDEEAGFYLEAMCYQISKEIAAMASVLKGKVDAVILTGKILESSHAVHWIEERCGFIAPVKKYPEQEALAFAQAALKVLRGEEKAKIY